MSIVLAENGKSRTSASGFKIYVVFSELRQSCARKSAARSSMNLSRASSERRAVGLAALGAFAYLFLAEAREDAEVYVIGWKLSGSAVWR